MNTRTASTIAIWHGYLLGATGSNIYTRHLVESWTRAGHNVVLVCQERSPEAYPEINDYVELAWDADSGEVTIAAQRTLREPASGAGRCTVVVPDIGGVLPVYVLDRYEGFAVHRYIDLDTEARNRFARAQQAALGWVIEHHELGGVLINHASPLPPAIGPMLEQSDVPYVVKVHGSELEYALAQAPELRPDAADALATARGVLVGSTHIARRTAELLGDRAVDPDRTHVVPPGVDLDRFKPIGDDPGSRADARERLLAAIRAQASERPHGRTSAVSEQVRSLVENPPELIDGLRALHGTYEERDVEQTAESEVAAIDADARIVVFVGKLIPQKGVHVLLATLPELCAKHPDLHIVIAGFGPLRDALEALLVAMQSRNVAALDELAAHIASLSGEGGDDAPHLANYFAAMRAEGAFERWLDAAASGRVAERVTWLGLVDHSVLAHLWPAAEVSVVPSILAEAFGMVAAEAAAAGCVPVVADHSGLADAISVIERNDVSPTRFDISDPTHAVSRFAHVLDARVSLPPDERKRQRAAARENVAAVWSWDEIARSVVATMTG